MKDILPCPEWEQQLSCTHPEDLSSVEQLALKTHVARCSACARTRAHYLETDDLLRSLPPIEPLSSLPTQIQHRRRGKEDRVVSFSVLLSVTVSTVARHAVLRQQPQSSEAPNSLDVTPPTSEVSDKAGQTSSQPLQEQRLPDRRSRKRSLVPVLVALLLIVGTGAGYWGFTTLGRNPAAHSPGTARHPTLTPIAHPTVAASYAGTIDDLRANVPSPMTLTQIRLQDGRISGSFSALHISATYSGSFLDAQHFTFIVPASKNLGQLYFRGALQADGSLAGDFCEVDQHLQCLSSGIFGVWSVAARPAP